jgi:hypothetical protein
MSNLYNFIDAQRLLIKPFNRILFIIIFVSATAICSAIGNYFWSQLISYILGDLSWSTANSLFPWDGNRLEYSIVAEMLISILTGTTIGLVQWLVLRRYLLSWRWILAVSMGFTIFSIHRAAASMWLRSHLASNLSGFGDVNTIALPIIFIVGGIIVTVFGSGYLQWYVLRSEVRQARWWIFVPLIAAIVVIVPSVLRYLITLASPALSLLLPPLDSYFIGLVMLPAVQAIGFCALHKKSSDDRPILQTPLANAPDLNDYWEIERIKKTLGTRISRVWKTDLEPAVGKITYLVGVDRSCTQIVYEPIDRNSLDNVALTPLPELVESSNYAARAADNSTALAKFQIVLAPPGTVEIKSWRGIPLKWLAVAVYLSILGVSILVTMLEMRLAPLSGN